MVFYIHLLLPDKEHEEVKFAISKSGKFGELLVDKSGFMYHKTTLHVGDKIHWICYDRKQFKCFGRTTTEGNYIIKKVVNHNHASTQKQIREKLEQNMKVFF